MIFVASKSITENLSQILVNNLLSSLLLDDVRVVVREISVVGSTESDD